MYLEEVNLVMLDSKGDVIGTETELIGKFVQVGMQRVAYNIVYQELRDDRLAGSGRLSILGLCFTSWKLRNIQWAIELDVNSSSSRLMAEL